MGAYGSADLFAQSSTARVREWTGGLPPGGNSRVRISTLPPLTLIKALIFRGFFVPVRFWSPIWSPIISVAFAGLLRIVMDVLFSYGLMTHVRKGAIFPRQRRCAWLLPAAIDPAPEYWGRFATHRRYARLSQRLAQVWKLVTFLWEPVCRDEA